MEGECESDPGKSIFSAGLEYTRYPVSLSGRNFIYKSRTFGLFTGKNNRSHPILFPEGPAKNYSGGNPPDTRRPASSAGPHFIRLFPLSLIVSPALLFPKESSGKIGDSLQISRAIFIIDHIHAGFEHQGGQPYPITLAFYQFADPVYLAGSSRIDRHSGTRSRLNPADKIRLGQIPFL